MLKKRIFSISIMFFSMLGLFSGCSSGEVKDKQDKINSKAEEKQVTLQFYNNVTGDVLEAYKKIATKFNEANPNIKVEVVSQGKDFENLMKVKMAANELPDMWTTHGWSVNRYSQYLRPLNDQSWSKDIVETIKPTITDSKGNIYVLPLDVDKSGIVYNKAVLEELKLEVPKTWDEFLNVCEQIKKSGRTPIYVGGKNAGTIAGMMDRIAPTFLVTYEKQNFAKDMKDGTFDWNNWDMVSEFIIDLKNKGYLNVDLLTADDQTTYRNLAENKAAFSFQSNNAISEVKLLNPNAKLGMMPIPTYYKDDTPVLVGGERDAVGVSKNTKNESQCLQFLKFLAAGENMTLIASSFGLPAGLNGVDSNLGSLKEDYNKYQSTRVFPVFDREYLPSGMWNTMQVVGPAILSGNMSAKDASKTMKDDYLRLRVK